MEYTQHEILLDYMTLSENEGQVGYSMLKKAIELSWYKLFKSTRESIVRKWVLVENGSVKYPKSLEKLLGVYIVDSCGDLKPLYEDQNKSILMPPDKKCSCNACDYQECMCPTVQDPIVQTDIVINGQPYTNISVTRVLKGGKVVEETTSWVASFNVNGSFKSAVKIESQVIKCTLDLLPCGCPVNSEVNAVKLTACGCITECYAPYMRERYPALYNDFGYYKPDYEKREIKLFSASGRRSRLIQVELVFQSSGADILVQEYARPALIALIDFSRKQYSPSFDRNDREEARRNWNREELEMIKYLNPIPYEWFVQVSDATKKFKNMPYYGKIHSDFVQPEVVTVCQTLPAQNITNIINSQQGGTGKKFKKIVGFEDGPTAGLGTYQHDDLKGLGDLSENKVDITIDKTDMYNWGPNPDFDFNSTSGTMTFRNGYVWQGNPASNLTIDLNQ